MNEMVEVYVAKAFSKDGKGGNRAGVVLDSPELTSYEKAETAKVLGYSETVFVSASHKADLKLEYFTTTGEVPLCGHATIAAFSVLRLLGRLDRQSYKIETKAGILNIQIKEDGLIFMEQNRPVYLEVLSPDIFTGCWRKDILTAVFRYRQFLQACMILCFRLIPENTWNNYLRI